MNLIVTKDGVELPDQKKAIEEFKRQASRSPLCYSAGGWGLTATPNDGRRTTIFFTTESSANEAQALLAKLRIKSEVKHYKDV
tara:strand:- start:5975 stop:6223 length:249 start_codon:yes stop_codon:yes gene_type:complete